MGCRQPHGPNCPCSMCSSCNSMPGCLTPRCRMPGSTTCPYCKANYRLYCYYLQGYQNLLRSKNRQLCMMEYFTRQMQYLKNAIQCQLEKFDKSPCDKVCSKQKCSPNEPKCYPCEQKFCPCEPKCFPCEPKCFPCEPKCFPCETKCYPCETKCYPCEPNCNTKFAACEENYCNSQAIYDLINQLNCIKQKLSCLENQKCCSQPSREFSKPCQCCSKPKSCQNCPKPMYTPPNCYCPTTVSKKPSCCCSPDRKNSLVFEISYETHEKKKKPQSRSHQCRCSSPSQRYSTPQVKRSDHNIIIDESGCVPKIRICSCTEPEEKVSCVPFLQLPSFFK